MITPRPRAELRGRLTRYEVVAELPGGRRIRLGFRSRINKRVLLDLARGSSERAAIAACIKDDDPAKYTAAGGWELGPVRIRRSGRTELDCLVEDGAQPGA